MPEGVDANDIIRRAWERYGVSLGAGLSQVAGKVFRIGHLGDLNELMVLSAIGVTEMAMMDCGMEIRLGAGVGAAQCHWRDADARRTSEAEPTQDAARPAPTNMAVA